MRQLKTILDPTAKSKVFLEGTAKTNKQTNKKTHTYSGGLTAPQRF